MCGQVSVIIPVYNCEKYLETCVDSVLNQSYQRIEIILVDDGAKDDSGNICDRYAKDYKNVRVIHQRNNGVSAARNTGLNSATGEYVMFVDSDDWLSPDTIHAMMNEAEHSEFDLVSLSICFDYEDGRIVEFKQPKITFDMQREVNDSFQRLYDCFFFNAVYAKLYKKSILEKYDLLFDRRYSILEDSTFVLNYLQHTEQVCCLPMVGYHYRQTCEESLVKKYNINELDAYINRSYVAASLEKVLNDENKSFYDTSVFNELWGILPKLYYRSGLSLKQKKNETIRFLDNEYVKSVSEKADFRQCNTTQKIKLFICRNKCWVGVFILLSVMGVWRRK